MRFKTFILGIAAASLASAAMVAAQDDGQAVQVVQVNVAQPVNDTPTSEQKRALDAGKRFVPGVYRIRSVHSGLCLAIPSSAGIPQVEACSRGPGFEATNQFVVLPHPAGGYTVRLHPASFIAGGRASTASEIGNCITVARGVLIGAARLEAKPCDVDGTDWTRAGAIDQRFQIFKAPSGDRTHQLAMMAIGDVVDCWALRGSSRDPGTEVIRWECAATADQSWEFQWVGPILPTWEHRLLKRTDWYRTPAGHRSVVKAAGIDLPGGDFSSFQTIADSGDYCMRRCAELDQCKAWTWSAAGYGNNPTPMCHWKSSVPRAANRGPAFAGTVISGTVRP